MRVRAFFLFLCLSVIFTVSIPRNSWGAATSCTSCGDCSDKINSGSWDTVELAADIVNHEGGCIYINTTSAVVFDCNGHSIGGDGLSIDPEDAIFVTGSSGVTVRECQVSGFDQGIYLFASEDITITQNTISANSSSGIQISSSPDNAINNNIIQDNTQGIVFSNASGNRVYSNTVCGNGTDFNVVSGTNLGDNNTCNLPSDWNDAGTTGCTYLCAGTVFCSSCEDCTSKLNGGYESVFLNRNITNHSGACIDFNTDDAVFDCNGHTIDGDDSGLDTGIRMTDQQGNTIRNCIVRGFDEGILLNNSENNTLHNNTLHANTSYGIRLEYADRNTIGHTNTASGNGDYGISLFRSDDNHILSNTVSGNIGGGMRLDDSHENTVSGNTVQGSIRTDAYGVILAAGSRQNYLTGNEILDNYYGVELDDADANALNNNTICSSASRDIRMWNDATGNFGDLNTCDYPGAWDDNGRYGCTFRCSSCTDGIQNYDETGVDCGGSYCPPCADCDTAARYAPPDTVCRNPWPSGEGSNISINTSDRSCDLFEVCDPNLDYIIEDALACCETENYLSTVTGDRLAGRREACSWAQDHAYNDNFRDNFNPISLKECLGRYIIKAFGHGAVYMQGYFRGEFCCSGSDRFCGESAPDCAYWWTDPAAWEMGTPDSCTHRVEETPDVTMDGHRCEYNHFLWWEWSEDGYWRSDTDSGANNDSAVDLPAHASINKYSTGTCVDYAITTTTILRKAGYLENEVLAVDGDGHDYVLVRFPDETKWRYADTTGNRGAVKNSPNFHCCKGTPESCGLMTDEETCDSVEGCSWSGSTCTGDPDEDTCISASFWDDETGCGTVRGCRWEICNYDYCRAMDQGCYNDNMSPSRDNCPSNEEIHGCEGIDPDASAAAESLAAQGKSAGLSIKETPASGVLSDATPAPDDCTELAPCKEENLIDVEPPPTPPNLVVKKTISKERIRLGNTVTVTVSITNLGKSPVKARMQENFIPGLIYKDLSRESEWYEELRVDFHHWTIVVPALGTGTVSFEVKPPTVGRFSLASTLVSSGGHIFKAYCDTIWVFCNPDGTCSPGEDVLFCKEDCPGGGQDGYCDRIEDGINDPDCPYGADPDFNEKADTDNDGVMDYQDRCPITRAGMTVDDNGCACYQKSCSDDDPLTIDSCVSSTASCTHSQDLDQDGVRDGKDNCPGIYNPDQRDTDLDGIGDQCEIDVITGNTTLDGKKTYYISDYQGNGAIRFGASKVTLDCSGSTIIGSGSGYGIHIPPGVGSVTIKNCRIRNFDYGIFLDKGGKNRLEDNRVESNRSGIVLGASTGNTLVSNDVMDNERAGISLQQSDSNTLTDNETSNNGSGITLQHSSGNVLSANQSCENAYSDIYEGSSSNSGTDNTCHDPNGWSDDFYLGCTHDCPNGRCEGDHDCDRDVDGADLAWYAKNLSTVDTEVFARDFGRTGCPACVQ